MVTEELADLRELTKSGNFVIAKQPGKYIKQDITNEYIADVLRMVGPVGKFKVVVDGCAATPGLFLPEILRRAGCEVIEQNTTPDGNFPVGVPDPTEEAVQKRLADRVVKEGADVGFSYDCDGDRMGVVDGRGGFIWNDTLVSLYSKDILEYNPGATIVYNNLCSKQVDEVIRLAKGQPLMWKTGHSFIKAKLKEERGLFGGELSGHFFFADNFYGHDDSAVASLRLLAYLTRKNKQLDEVVAELPQYISSPEIKVGCPDNIKFNFVSEKLGGKLKELYPDARYIEIDGVRMDTDAEMIVMRASQNGPYLTIKFEAKTKERYEVLKEQIKNILHAFSEVDSSYGVNVSALD
jgi:phosphomannomutase/phosphoglucomutase